MCRLWSVDLEVNMKPRLPIFLRLLFSEGIKVKSCLLQLNEMSSVEEAVQAHSNLSENGPTENPSG